MNEEGNDKHMWIRVCKNSINVLKVYLMYFVKLATTAIRWTPSTNSICTLDPLRDIPNFLTHAAGYATCATLALPQATPVIPLTRSMSSHSLRSVFASVRRQAAANGQPLRRRWISPGLWFEMPTRLDGAVTKPCTEAARSLSASNLVCNAICNPAATDRGVHACPGRLLT